MIAVATGLALMLTTSLAFGEDAPQYTESIDVVRYLVDTRAVDFAGKAIRDLTADDFVVTINGNPVTVEAASWIAAGDAWPEWRGPQESGEEANDLPVNEEPSTGRLLVFFIQTDFGRNIERTAGQMKFNSFLAKKTIEMMQPEDQAAVLSFDSHLKLRLDFTSDRELIRKAVQDSILINRVSPPKPRLTGPSLARQLDPDAMLKASSDESALLLLANGLHAIEGRRIMILAGWGMGRRLPGYGRATVMLPPGLSEAIDLLRLDHIPVITINTGVGGDLSVGLQQAAKSTGGVYLTLDWPYQTLARIEGTLAGHYELMLRVEPPLKPGQYRLDVRSKRRNVLIHTPPFVQIAEAANQAEHPVGSSDNENVMSARELFATAMHSLREGEIAGVEELLTRAVGLDPRLADAWYERAMLRAAAGKLEDAGADLRSYLEIAPRGTHAADARDMLRGFVSSDQ